MSIFFPRGRVCDGRVRLVAAGVAALAAGGAVALSSAAARAAAVPGHRADGATMRLGPSAIYNAPNVQDYEDAITSTFTAAGNPDQVQFVLRTPPAVTWWKGIRLTTKTGSIVLSDYTQDAKHNTNVLNLSRAAVAGGAYIVFSKAKTFGVHTDMYTVAVPAGDLGYRITLNWLKD